ncbi:phosphoadenosine phosphosulfate reductase family protein [Paracrocinitomix mangrovi]|uniref:phosphoadenosine phosphosulfate reductase domain-containing protein n=1 Tax=Paracrocinitomix mangrovi TaxID=2862509 RepID=UPI001C8E2538|nr:phosphoadenosine phosphosulfate reductase family protein [Paracrocinitomix mangrovi]UKN01768.1 phosphoadenosine phosphosulfate reductase family protein [Paracrocinitomix mangrovi]
MTAIKENLEELNLELRNALPEQIVRWALKQGNKAIVTTNFRPYEAAILHACTQVSPAIDVIWCDTGYNTPNTYKCAQQIIDQLNLKIDLFVPQQTSAFRDALMGIPSVEDDNHTEFTRQVKLEPFQRAMQKHRPDIWFTNLRKGQTALRDKLDILSFGSDGVLKVSPFYYYSDEDLDTYLLEHNLPNEFKYYDPTKALENRECGLHTLVK